MTRLFPSLLLTPLLLLPALASAQLDAETIAIRFQEMDRNKDGKLTSNEAPRWLFNRLDTDKNQEVLLDEAQKALTKRSNPLQASPLIDVLFQRLDANGDGALTREESFNAEWFDRLDKNEDGKVDMAEAFALSGGTPTPSEPPADLPKIAQGPEVLKPGDVGVGRQVPEVTFTDLEGNSHKLSDFSDSEALVIAYTSTTCPVSKRFAGSLARLESGLEEQGIPMLFVNPFASEDREDILAQIDEQGFGSPYVHDTDKSLSRALNAHTTTEVFLLDSTRTLIYRGALSDQYGISYNRDEARVNYLEDALAAIKDGRRPVIAATAAPGCELDLGEVADRPSTELTYHRDIERILQQNCVQCHNDNGIAPFSLQYLDEVQDRTKVIQRVVSDGVMPPWFAEDEEPHSPWANDRSLSEQDKADLLAWLKDPKRQIGDPKDAPKPMVFKDDGWDLGEPDHVVAAKPVAVKAEGIMDYVNLNVPTGIDEEKWISAIEVQPGVREVVHHILIFLRDPSSPGQRFDELNGYFAVYVPGTSTIVYPEGMAKRLPAGSELRFQMHYTPNGKAVTDVTKIGFHFADDPPAYEVQVASVANPRIKIPAGVANHVEYGHRLLRDDITILGFLAHMHIRGKAFKYELVRPGGNEVLLDIPRYDFNWQLYYQLKEPMPLSMGNTIKVTAAFDNSAENPANPDPTQEVRWGKQTFDEMMIGYVEYIIPVDSSSDLTAGIE